VSMLIGFGISVMLLVLYVCAVVTVVRSPTRPPNEAVETALSSVGGLVAALVAAVLAITPPAGNPARVLHSLAGGLAGSQPGWLFTALVGAYVVVWLVSGLSLWLAWMRLERGQAPDALKSAAKAWLGLAVAAGFSYFGLEPPM